MTMQSTNPSGPPPGSRRTWYEELTANGEEVVERVKQIVEEGNVRRVTIKQDGRTLVEFPLTFGVVGALLAPQLAALGAIAALVSRCSITVEREEPPPSGSSGFGTDEPPPVGGV